MARPAKNNCDYFPHDAGMRDHKKVKSIRAKFGISGYAIWVMLLEHLTGNDGNVFEYSDMEFELMSGSFGVSATEIRDVVDYCIRLEMLFNRDGFVNSDSLDERLAPVYEKRGKAKVLSAKQRRVNGKYATVTPQATVVSVTEMPQSKVKESKGERINITPDVYTSKENAFTEIRDNDQYIEECTRTLSGRGWMAVAPIDVIACLKQFLNAKADLSTPRDNVRQHFKNWLIREKIENLITYSDVFKKSAQNGRTERQSA
jgi:hypothetical protein